MGKQLSSSPTILPTITQTMSYLNHVKHLSSEALNKENMPPSVSQSIANKQIAGVLKEKLLNGTAAKKVKKSRKSTKEPKYPSSMDKVEPLLIEAKNRFV